MSKYIAPGVNVEEVSNGVRPIEAANTSTAAFVGHFEKGPINEAAKVPSMKVFEDVYGEVSARRQASLAINLFFQNGGSDAYVLRVAESSSREGKGPNALEFFGDRKSRTGMYALDAVGSFNLLVLPDIVLLDDNEAAQIVASATAYCGERRAFCILDVPQKTEIRHTADQVKKWLDDHDHLRDINAAIYFPRLLVENPENNGTLISVGPSGAIAGLYARTDIGRGVWKSPAGIEAALQGVRRLEHTLTDKEIQILNELAVNCLKEVGSRGCITRGARTFLGSSREGDGWKYVRVRRLALLIEESVYRGTKWVVFEPQNESLWAKVRQQVRTFMLSLFECGALQGSTPKEAYFVDCGHETMTTDDLDRGVVNVLIGFAPFRPAEFVPICIRLIPGQA